MYTVKKTMVPYRKLTLEHSSQPAIVVGYSQISLFSYVLDTDFEAAERLVSIGLFWNEAPRYVRSSPTLFCTSTISRDLLLDPNIFPDF